MEKKKKLTESCLAKEEVCVFQRLNSTELGKLRMNKLLLRGISTLHLCTRRQAQEKH